VAWESFHSLGSVPFYGAPQEAKKEACCAPNAATVAQPAKAACCG